MLFTFLKWSSNFVGFTKNEKSVSIKDKRRYNTYNILKMLLSL